MTRLYVEERHAEAPEAGAPVLLLHGFTGSGSAMAGVADALPPGTRTLLPDLVGHGASPAPEDPGAYAMEACCADLASMLAERRARPAHVVGYSMGARVALALAVYAPHTVRSLVLVGGRAGLGDPVQRAGRIADDEALAEQILSRGLAWFVDHWMGLPLFASQARLGEAALAVAREQRLKGTAQGLAGSLRGMGAGAQPPLFAALPRVAVPVLLVTGDEDQRFGAAADDLARRLPRATRCVIPRAGHAAHLENPAAFQEALRAFLAEVEAEAPTLPGAGTSDSLPLESLETT